MVYMDRPQVVLIDFHGVLTDGKQSITHDGQYMFDHIHTRDVRSIRELIAIGFEVYIVTSSNSPIIKHFADKVGCEIFVVRNKTDILPFGHNDRKFIFIGDDAWDVKVMEYAAEKYCPADADYSVKSIPGVVVMETAGGRGVIAEFISKFGT